MAEKKIIASGRLRDAADPDGAVAAARQTIRLSTLRDAAMGPDDPGGQRYELDGTPRRTGPKVTR